jgi:hypothetical protein
MTRIPIFKIAKPLTWESQKKCHLDVALMLCPREYYKGEVTGFPQIWTMVSFVNPYMPMVHMCTKNVSIMH